MPSTAEDRRPAPAPFRLTAALARVQPVRYPHPTREQASGHRDSRHDHHHAVHRRTSTASTSSSRWRARPNRDVFSNVGANRYASPASSSSRANPRSSSLSLVTSCTVRLSDGTSRQTTRGNRDLSHRTVISGRRSFLWGGNLRKLSGCKARLPVGFDPAAYTRTRGVVVSKPLSRRRERAQLTELLRTQGMSWVEMADVLGSRYQVNARVALRLAHGWSQRQAAEAWNHRWPNDLKTAKNFSYWETWPISGHAPSLVTLDKLAQLYECSVADLLVDVSDYRHLDDARGFEAGTSRRDTGGRGDHEGASPTLDDVRDLWDRLLRRRDFLAGAGASAAATLLGGQVSNLGRSAPAIDAAIEGQAALTANYWHLEGLLGPKTVFAQALDHHRLLTSWLRQAGDDEAWQQVAELAANAGVLLGWLHFDLEQYDQAAVVYRRTLDIADELSDVDLQAFLTGRMSRTLSECERHTEALVFAELAGRVGSSGATPAVRSWLSATRAYVHACLGDERASRADLDRAYDLLDEADGDPPPTYIAFYGKPNLHKWAGHTLLRLAEHRAAAPREGRSVIDQALAMWPSSGVRESGEVLVAGASARLAEREIDEAVRLTSRAYDIAAHTGSPRVLRHVTSLRQRMTPYRQTRAVRALDEHLLTGS